MAAFCSQILRLDLPIFRVPTTITRVGRAPPFRAFLQEGSSQHAGQSQWKRAECLPVSPRFTQTLGRPEAEKIDQEFRHCGAWMSHLRWCRRRASLLRGSVQSDRMSKLPHCYIKAKGEVRGGKKMCLGVFERPTLHGSGAARKPGRGVFGQSPPVASLDPVT